MNKGGGASVLKAKLAAAEDNQHTVVLILDHKLVDWKNSL